MNYLNRENSKKVISNNQFDLIYVLNENGGFKAAHSLPEGQKAAFTLPNVTPESLGDDSFKADYHVKYALCSGAMANKIASKEMVVAMGKAGFLGSFGAGGCSILDIEEAIDYIETELKDRNYMINMLSNRDLEMEMKLAEMLIRKNVPAVEASAYVKPSKALVYYRVSGLKANEDGSVYIPHKVMGKISREEVLKEFIAPPNKKIIEELLKEDKISKEEALLAEKIPMADDITIEGDSGGHTDGRPLISILPGMITLSNALQKNYNYEKTVRIGAAGGISTNLSALGAFLMGASYVVTGSINQSCIEAGTSKYVKEMLRGVSAADVVMSPSADMFETGGQVQVIKKETMFPQNAKKLYEYYKEYKSLEDIPSKEIEKIEKRILKSDIKSIWESTKSYFEKVDPKKIMEAEKNPKKKMALIFRWYLGNSSRWAVSGNLERKIDMQIWCGQSLGAFNNWVKGSYLEPLENRKISEISYEILKGASYSYVINLLKMCQVDVSDYENYEIVK